MLCGNGGEAFGCRDRGSDSHLYTSLGRDSSGYGDVLAHGMYNGIVVHTPHLISISDPYHLHLCVVRLTANAMRLFSRLYEVYAVNQLLLANHEQLFCQSKDQLRTSAMISDCATCKPRLGN
jgi:hypothetical protein